MNPMESFCEKILPFRWFWPVFSHITEYRNIKKQFHWPKKDSNEYCGSYKIISATTEWKLKTTVFEKNTFPVKKNTYSFFLLIPRFADVHNKFITLHKYSSENGARKKVSLQRPGKLLKTKYSEKKG